VRGRDRNGGDLSAFSRSLRSTFTVLEIAVGRVKALDKGRTSVNKQRLGLRSTSTNDGRVSSENIPITAGRLAHFADWKRATARHVAGKCAQHCPQPSGVEMCVCVCVCVCVCACVRLCVCGQCFKELHRRLRSSSYGSLSLIHLHVSPIKESSVCSESDSSRLHSYRERNMS